MYGSLRDFLFIFVSYSLRDFLFRKWFTAERLIAFLANCGTFYFVHGSLRDFLFRV